MLHRLVIPALGALFLSAGCTAVRTVYDSQGNEIKDDEQGGEKDLMSTYEKRFDAAFSEQKNKEGVPQTTSSKISSFQQELDDARRIDKPFAAGRFDTGKHLDLRDSGFAGADKQFATDKSGIERTVNSMYSTDLRPDFMNESHGISHERSYSGASRNIRSQLEGFAADGMDKTHHLTDYEPYTTNSESNYVEHRRNKTKQPVIIDYRDYYQRHKNSVRQLLGRDNEPQ